MSEIASEAIGEDSCSELKPGEPIVKISTPTLVPPIRFGHVNPGVTRGAYPTLRNFRHLSRFQLKTIISLTPEPPISDLQLFAEMAGIKLIHLPISRMASLTEAAQATVVTALNVRTVYMSNTYIHRISSNFITPSFCS